MTRIKARLDRRRKLRASDWKKEGDNVNATLWSPMLALPISPDRDHVRGPVNAAVTLVEYGDYECPYCNHAHSNVQAILRHLGPRIRFVFRHFPMVTVHPHAQRAAEAAEAAGAQGKFWQMHDLLYASQQPLSDVWLVSYAKTLNLDIEAFHRDLTRHLFLPRVREDFMSGVHGGVQGTPTFFIDGERYDADWDFDALLAGVVNAMQRSGAVARETERVRAQQLTQTADRIYDPGDETTAKTPRVPGERVHNGSLRR